MFNPNDTIKSVALLGGVGIVGYLGYKYYQRKEQEETIASKLKTIIIDANASGKSVLPAVKEVVKDIKADPKLQSYSVSEYKAIANSLYNYMLAHNSAGVIKMFSYMNTNVDMRLLNIYFGVKTYKIDNFGKFEVMVWNLSQFYSKLVLPDTQKKIDKILKDKGINYKII